MSWITLQASDGHRPRAWQAEPAGQPRGSIVVLQEIFGVNAHIRTVCDRYAQQGWLAVAPSLFDRAGGPEEGLGYAPEEMAKARELKARVPEDKALLDVEAAVAHCRSRAPRVAVVGFCWGGTLAWLAGSRIPGVSSVVAYYGTAIAAHLDEAPRVPVLLHFGDRDTHIPPADVEAIGRAHPAAELHRYPAGHGFNCDVRPSFDPDSAALAAERTGAFLARHLEG
ncbi:MAG: dienelactone hydrolase family protein [Frateuria sp.]|nr:dienelactone hydrolase family protein [Frateuria sp.]